MEMAGWWAKLEKERQEESGMHIGSHNAMSNAMVIAHGNVSSDLGIGIYDPPVLVLWKQEEPGSPGEERCLFNSSKQSIPGRLS